MSVDDGEAYLKYALFCRDTTEGPGDELALEGIIDLIELPAPQAGQAADQAVLAEVDVHLVFCIEGATPGPHHLLVVIKAPGIPRKVPGATTQNIPNEAAPTRIGNSVQGVF